MTEIQPRMSGVSPFDAIRRVRRDGTEYWSARELMPLMGYARWENLAPAISRAMASARNQGLDIEENFLGSQEVAGRRGPTPKDYELSRMAAYLVAMNGDPNKPEVAAAQVIEGVAERDGFRPASLVMTQVTKLIDTSNLGDLRLCRRRQKRRSLGLGARRTLTTCTNAKGTRSVRTPVDGHRATPARYPASSCRICARSSAFGCCGP